MNTFRKLTVVEGLLRVNIICIVSGVVHSGEEIRLRCCPWVCPHRAKLKSFLDRGGNRTRDIWFAIVQCSTNWGTRSSRFDNIKPSTVNSIEWVSSIPTFKQCLHCIGSVFASFAKRYGSSVNSFRPRHSIAFVFSCIYLTKIKMLQMSLEKVSKLYIPVNKVRIASVCLLEAFFNHELNPQLLRLVFTLQWERCKNESGTIRTAWKSGAMQRQIRKPNSQCNLHCISFFCTVFDFL